MWKISFIIRISNQIWWNFEASSILFLIRDFKLLSCELDILHLKCYIEFSYIILKQNKIIIL